MRVLFISANTEKINMPALPLGLACVASATQASGHDVALIDLRTESDTRPVLKGAIRGFRPEVIGISVRNIDDQNMENPRFLLDQVKGVVAACRSLSAAKIVLGGAGYSIFPESALSFLGADMGVQGEGEIIFPELMNRMARGAGPKDTSGLYVVGSRPRCKRVFAKGLDKLPLPDTRLWSLPRQRENLWMPVQTRRGCPLDCSYCSTGTIEGWLIRKRSPAAVARWIALWRKAGIRQFYFVDNTFNLPLAYAKALCRKLIEYRLDIKWWSILYPKDVDEEVVELMAAAGCEQVSLGFESGSTQMLKKLNKRFGPKEVRQISRLLSDHGLRQMGFLLLGGPGETRASVEESLVFADSLALDILKITVGLRIYPFTLLSKVAADKGIISPQDNLLFPRFYMERAVEGWLQAALRKWAAVRAHWKISA